MADQESIRWVTAQVLAELKSRKVRAGHELVNAQLREWTGLQTRQIGSALKKLQQLEFVLRNGKSYTVTQSGATAIESHVSTLKSGPKGPQENGRAVPEHAFAMKLWKLLRVRITLDCDAAASVLVDAGNEDEFKRAKQTASRYLNRWAKTPHVSTSREYKRGTCKRYVLIKDSPEPPAWSAKAQARQAQGAQA